MFQATVVQTGEVVAIKKVLQDKRFKNRELQIMRKLNHPNIVHLKHCFYSTGDNAEELYLNLVLVSGSFYLFVLLLVLVEQHSAVTTGCENTC